MTFLGLIAGFIPIPQLLFWAVQRGLVGTRLNTDRSMLRFDFGSFEGPKSEWLIGSVLLLTFYNKLMFLTESVCYN